MNKEKSYSYAVTLISVAVAFAIGVAFGQEKLPYNRANDKLTDLDRINKEQFAPFWRAWQILDEKFVDISSTTAQDKIWGAVGGLASAYKDPYTVFFPPVESKMFKDDISGNFEGVGMEIGIKDGQLTVVSPIKNSPAYKAGVKAGDRILKIDDTITVDLAVDKAVKLIRGPKGTTVKITFLPANSSKPQEKAIIRDIIDIPTIDTSSKDDIFIIKLYSFTAQSPNLFRNALREFVLSGKNKLILDLRGNPGGYLDAAWDMASWFLPAGQVVVTEDFGKNGEPKIYRSKGYNIFDKNLKLLILLDGGSASASEILAGALDQNGVGKLVGTKTFGKGSVQELVSLTSDTSLKVTIARWLTPNGTNLSKNGLVPEYEVKLDENNTKDGKDPIMEKALGLLKS